MIIVIVGILVLIALCTPVAIVLASNARECPECKYIVHPDARVCGHCGHALPDAKAQTTNDAAPGFSPLRLLLAVIGVVVLSVVALALAIALVV